MNTFVSSCRRFAARATFFATALAGSVFASEVSHWNAFSVGTTSAAMPDDPLSESRILAIVHLSMHDALNRIEARFGSFLDHPGTPVSASPEAAVASAARRAMVEYLPDQAAEVDAEFSERIQRLPQGAAVERGIELGRAVAERVIAQRRDDGSAHASPRAAGSGRGEYQPTPPDFTPAVASHWGDIVPFALRSAVQFRPAPPPALESLRMKEDCDDVREVGGLVSHRRTPEQSEIAKYWYEHSTRGWNRIARTLCSSRGMDLWDEARFLALVNVAMADGFIAGFEAKYHYYRWRPATAVRAEGAADWLSFLPTPPVPDYPSTHTVLGAAAATAMARLLRTDYVTFEMTSGAPYPGITRRFWCLSQAARENGASRVLAGLHFNCAVEAGYTQGTQVGEWAVQSLLQPLRPVGVSVTLGE